MEMVILALAAHPDDIEFMMAGTMLLLGKVGCRLHYCNLANGCCGYRGHSPEYVAGMREKEVLQAAGKMNAIFHQSLFNDLEIFYNEKSLRMVSALFRKVAPDILLLPSLADYMEDHVNTARLGITAAFARSMDNWRSLPPVEPIKKDCSIYHAMPFGLHDGLSREVRSGLYIDIADVMDQKQEMLACHRSQQEWLDQSQGLNSYLAHMKEMSLEMGRLSGKFSYAEGWTKHNPSGFCPHTHNPLQKLLGERYVQDSEFFKQPVFA